MEDLDYIYIRSDVFTKEDLDFIYIRCVYNESCYPTKIDYIPSLEELWSFKDYAHEDQYSKIFGQNVWIIFGFQNYHKLNTNINIQWKIFVSNIRLNTIVKLHGEHRSRNKQSSHLSSSQTEKWTEVQQLQERRSVFKSANDAKIKWIVGLNNCQVLIFSVLLKENYYTNTTQQNFISSLCHCEGTA